MAISAWMWIGTLGGLVAMLLVDLVLVARRPHRPSNKEAASWIAFYVSAALAFGAALWVFKGGNFASQFYAGWLTEYSLSVDNLVVFMLIMGSFKVPEKLQQKVLLLGIVLALLLRGIFIGAGSALINRFTWIFYLFGAFLIYTAYKLFRGEDEDDEFKENPVLRFAQRHLRVTDDFADGKFLTWRPLPGGGRRRMLSLMVIVMIAIGTTDLIFAFDSIPAIFGLTTDAYIVFTANVFALMGLRQLFFLVSDLLARLKYLSRGLGFVLGFIGLKLILEALHDNRLPFINGGHGIEAVPEIPTLASLAVIVVILAITAGLSLWSSSGAAAPPVVAPSKRDLAEEPTGRPKKAEDPGPRKYANLGPKSKSELAPAVSKPGPKPASASMVKPQPVPKPQLSATSQPTTRRANTTSSASESSSSSGSTPQPARAPRPSARRANGSRPSKHRRH